MARVVWGSKKLAAGPLVPTLTCKKQRGARERSGKRACIPVHEDLAFLTSKTHHDVSGMPPLHFGAYTAMMQDKCISEHLYPKGPE